MTKTPSRVKVTRADSPRPRMVSVPGDGGQAGAEQEVQPPVTAIPTQDGEQLVAAGEGRDDDGQGVILDQYHSDDQAQGGPQVTHGSGVRAAALVEDASEYM